MNRAALVQQFIGVISISLPLVIFYYFIPHYFFSAWGVALCSFITALYLAYKTYKNAKNQTAVLKFVPSDQYLQRFQKEIAACKMQPDKVALRYAYVNDGIAMALFHTILIDPMVWNGIDDDQEAAKIKEVIEKYILPGIAENNKALHASIKKILTPQAQCFIFRHELGHVWYNYSYKRILLVGLIGFFAAGTALMAARAAMLAWGGAAALLVGIVVGAAADLLLSYASNIFFKAREEKKADMFAARFSSKEEIEAAADFFEQYEHHAQEYRKSMGGLIAHMPTIILSGHIDGIRRAGYLRDVVRSK